MGTNCGQNRRRVSRSELKGLRGQSIGVVTPSFFPMIGGVESYVLGVGRELVRLGHEVSVYTPDSVLGRHLPKSEENIDGIKIHRVHVPLDLSYRVKIWPDLVGELARDGPDVIHVYSHDSYALPALLAARACGSPFFVTTYGPFETHSEYGVLERRILRLYDVAVSPAIFRRSDCVLVRYPALASWLKAMHVPDEKIRLEPSGMPRDSLVPRDGSEFRGRRGLNGPTILYLGRISPQKGVHHAVDAMRHVVDRHQDAMLVLIGPDYVGFSSTLKASAEKRGIGDNLMILPPMSDEESQLEAIAACDIFLMPSTFEGFSQAVLKAMGQSKPVVVTKVGGLPYEVAYGECGYLCPYGEPESLATAILAILKDKEIASRMGRAGRERAELFTFNVLARSLSSTYAELGS